MMALGETWPQAFKLSPRTMLERQETSKSGSVTKLVQYDQSYVTAMKGRQ